MRTYVFEVTTTHTPLASLQTRTIPSQQAFEVSYQSAKGSLPMIARIKYYWFSFVLWWDMNISGRF